jgi:hypothetical protein
METKQPQESWNQAASKLLISVIPCGDLLGLVLAYTSSINTDSVRVIEEVHTDDYLRMNFWHQQRNLAYGAICLSKTELFVAERIGRDTRLLVFDQKTGYFLRSVDRGDGADTAIYAMKASRDGRLLVLSTLRHLVLLCPQKLTATHSWPIQCHKSHKPLGLWLSDNASECFRSSPHGIDVIDLHKEDGGVKRKITMPRAKRGRLLLVEDSGECFIAHRDTAHISWFQDTGRTYVDPEWLMRFKLSAFAWFVPYSLLFYGDQLVVGGTKALFFFDRNRHTVMLVLEEHGGRPFDHISDLAVNSDGLLFASDYANHRVLVFR